MRFSVCRAIVGLLVVGIMAACGSDGPTGTTPEGHLFRYVPASTTETITSVHVVGSFNDWNTTARPMTRQADGTWQVRVLLGSGTYQYKYFFNGEHWAGDMCNDARWGNPTQNNRVDPAVTQCQDDGFGGQNGVLVIP